MKFVEGKTYYNGWTRKMVIYRGFIEIESKIFTRYFLFEDVDGGQLQKVNPYASKFIKEA